MHIKLFAYFLTTTVRWILRECFEMHDTHSHRGGKKISPKIVLMGKTRNSLIMQCLTENTKQSESLLCWCQQCSNNEFAVGMETQSEWVNKQVNEQRRSRSRRSRKKVQFRNKNCVRTLQKRLHCAYTSDVFILRYTKQHQTVVSFILLFLCSRWFGLCGEKFIREACFATQIHTCTYTQSGIKWSI